MQRGEREEEVENKRVLNKVVQSWRGNINSDKRVELIMDVPIPAATAGGGANPEHSARIQENAPSQMFSEQMVTM